MRPFLFRPLLLTILSLQATVVASVCRVHWQVGCGEKTVTSNVTFYLLDDVSGASVDPQYDADVLLHWGPTADDLATRTYNTGESVGIIKSHQYAMDGGYYTGYAVTFGEGSGMGCEGRTFEGYRLVMFDDDSNSCMFGPPLSTLPRASTDSPTKIPTSPPSKRPTRPPTTTTTTTTTTPSRRSIQATPPPTKIPTRRPTPPEPNVPLIIPEPPTPQLASGTCGDDICSVGEYDDYCLADCADVVLRADPEGGEVEAPGIMFSIRPTRHVVVTSMDVFSTSVGVFRVSLFWKAGGFEGHEEDTGAWEPVYNNFNELRGPEEHTTLNLNNGRGVVVPEDGLASFYVLTESMLRCMSGTGVGDVSTSDNVLEIYQGVEMEEKWTVRSGGDGSPLAFRGAIKYDVVKSAPTAAPTVMATPTAKPTFDATPAVDDVGSIRTVSPTGSNIRPTSSFPTTKQPGTNVPPPHTTPTSVADATSIPISPTQDRPTLPDSPTDIITTPPIQYKVSSEMVLKNSELLDTDSKRIWVDVTTETIRNQAVAMTRVDSKLVEVEVELEDQDVMEQVRMLTSHHQRSLQQLPLRILFTSAINVPPEDDDLDPNQVVASAFQTPRQLKDYINALQVAEDGSYFEGLESVRLEVDEGFITEETASTGVKSAILNMSMDTDGTGGGSDKKMYYIIATSVGGALILLLVGAIGIHYAKRRKNKESIKVQSSTTGTQDHHLLDRVGLEIDTKSAPISQPTNYIGTIESREEVDDVSTLGDPYMGDAVNAVMDTDRTVGESIVSSQQGHFVYGVGRPGGMDAASRVGGSTINSGSYVRNMIFGEDTTLEDIYRAPHGTSMGEEDQSSNFHQIVVVAPAGKLGIVLDNPHGDLPIVWAIKETSALNGKVRVGDLLLSVDGVDCRGMSTNRVSTFLSSRSQNPTRTMVLARGTETGTEMVGV